MKKIAIVGAGGFGREVKMLIEQLNYCGVVYELIGFYDDNFEVGTVINGSRVLGSATDLLKINYNLEVVISIADPLVKRRIYENLRFNTYLNFPTLIHPSSIIGNDDVLIGYGCVICAANIITVNIVIGNFVTINLGCTVGHDTKIGDYCSIMPSVNVSGEVVIEDSVYIGTGVKIINLLTIGNSTIIGSGAVVTSSLPVKCTAVGIPAKPIKFHE